MTTMSICLFTLLLADAEIEPGNKMGRITDVKNVKTTTNKGSKVHKQQQQKKMMDHPNDDNVAAAAALAVAAIAMDDDDNDNNNNEDAADDNDDDDDDDELLLAVNNFEQDDDDDDAEEEEEEEEEGDFIYDPAEGKRICDETMSILKHRLDFSAGQRDKSIVRFAQQFIKNVKDDIHYTFTAILEEGYDGLDSARDTEAEVETAIRCCPEN